MTAHELAGYAAPGPGSCFLIPYFRSIGSNFLLVQELDTSFRVQRFVAFEPSRFEEIPAETNTLLDVGDHGHIAVRTMGQLVSGTADYVASALQPFATNDPSVFFRVEAFQFICDAKELRRAMSDARAVFSTDRSFEMWFATEQATLDRIASGGSPFPQLVEQTSDVLDRLVDELIASENAPNWPALWSRAWQNHQPEKRIADVGIWWIKRQRLEHVGTSSILRAISRKHYDLEVVELCKAWLSLEHYSRPYWEKLWSRTYGDLGESPGLTRLAIQYLRSTTARMPPRPAQWCRVWERLFHDREVRHELVAIAIDARDQMKRQTRFMHRVALSCVRAEGPGGQMSQWLMRWLQEERSLPHVWARAFVPFFGLAERSSSLHRALTDIGTTWLSNDHAIGIWVDVWDSLTQSASDPREYTEMLLRRLRSIRSPNTVSPRTLHRVLERNQDESVVFALLNLFELGAVGGDARTRRTLQETLERQV